MRWLVVLVLIILSPVEFVVRLALTPFVVILWVLEAEFDYSWRPELCVDLINKIVEAVER